MHIGMFSFRLYHAVKIGDLLGESCLVCLLSSVVLVHMLVQGDKLAIMPVF